MKNFHIINYYKRLFKYARIRRYCTNEYSKNKTNIHNIRNIGILAHIDAGKTTTTERMLFYSGTIRSMGEVHHGNTVTDYMEQERQRGITITSAAVSFPWRDSQINLIDTPGHIDFTMEVEQSLAVLDGAVVVLDASAGVEAQTLTVWRQADAHGVPRLLYLNKMDRADADAAACARSVQDKLHATPLVLHAPVTRDGRLVGLIDFVMKEEVMWTKGRGQHFERRRLTERGDGRAWESAAAGHRQLVDTLSAADDALADAVIHQETLDDLNTDDINAAIRRCTIDMKAFPMLCGSSYKNIGVQSLMDAVVAYLPSPAERRGVADGFGEELSARAFKVRHDDQRGVLTFLRLYSGSIARGQKIYNLARDCTEQTGSLYVALADEFRPADAVSAGNIAVVSALKATMSGDLITSSQAAAARARSALARALRDPARAAALPPAARRRLPAGAEAAPEDAADALLGIGATVPEPVFLCSVEPPSAAYQGALEAALAELQREDPSLRVSTDDDSGQMVLAGMGELHLEIIKERIIREYKIEVELGAPQISYREALAGAGRRALAVDRKIGNARQVVKVELSARSVAGLPRDKALRLDRSSAESAANLAGVHPRSLAAVRQGVATALLHGPKLGCPLVDTQVTLHWFEAARGTADSAVAAAVVQCLRKVFEEADSVLLEPVMLLEVVCPESHAARVTADLARRRADVRHVQLRHDNKVIECLAPLSELLGYSSALRSLSSGLATFSMQFYSNRQMAPHDEQKAIKTITGF